jgi:predicted nucleotide-binding protein (sugar kinase/HSP70/actin superfamily)
MYGDVFMRVLYRMRPYEKTAGSANALHEKWKEKCLEQLKKPGLHMGEFKKNLRGIIEDFDALPIFEDMKKPRVGIVGEILVKFLPSANNYLVELLEAEGAEAVMPDLLDFFYYSFYNSNFKADYLGMSKKTKRTANLGIWALNQVRKPVVKACKKSKHFTPPSDIRDLAKMADPIVSLGNQTGEGWFLTGEMMELIHNGVPNIVCAQPFGCLPNHVVGKGVIKNLRNQHPEANIVAVDYDPGASEVNQLNRIKLMLATANKQLGTV